MREGPKTGAAGALKNITAAPGKISVHRDGPQTHHFWSETETAAYVDWINKCLMDDPDLTAHLPISNEGTALFESCRDGLVLGKLVNSSVPGTIDEKTLNKKPKLPAHKSENLTKVLTGCRAIGIQVHNIGPEDIMNATPHLVLGLVWQIIKVGLLAKIQNEPMVSVGAVETPAGSIDNLATPETRPKIPKSNLSHNEKSLLVWLNNTLEKLSIDRRVNNFGSDLSDSIVLAHLVNYLTPDDVKTKLDIKTVQEETDMYMRAELVLDAADRFQCRQFASPSDIVNGNKNLNMAFIAVLYNTRARAAEAEHKTIQLQQKLQSELAEAMARTELQLQRSKEDMEVIINNLRGQLTKTEKERTGLEMEVENLKVHNETLNARLHAMEKATGLDGAKDKNSSALAEFKAAAEKEIEDLKSAIVASQQEASDLKSKMTSLEKESGDMRKLKINLQSKLDVTTSEFASLRDSTETQIQKLNSLLDAAIKENNELKSLNLQLEKSNAENQTKIAELGSTMDVTIADLQHAKFEADQNVQKTQALLVASQEECASLKSTVLKMEATNKSNIEEKQKMLMKLDLVLKELSNRKDDHVAYDKKITTGFSEIASLRAQSEGMKAKIAEMELSGSAMLKEKERLQEENRKILSEAETMRTEYSLLKKRMAEEGSNHSADTKKLQSLLELAERQLAESSASVTLLKDQLLRLEEEKKLLSKQLDIAKIKLVDDVTQLHEETLTLKKSLDSSERELVRVKEALEKNTEELNMKNVQMETILESETYLKDTLRHRDNTIATLESQIGTLNQEKLTMSQNLVAKEKDLHEKLKRYEEKNKEANLQSTLSRQKQIKMDDTVTQYERELNSLKALLHNLESEIKDVLSFDKLSNEAAAPQNDNELSSTGQLCGNVETTVKTLLQNMKTIKQQAVERKVAREMSAEERQQKVQFRELYKTASRRLSALEIEIETFRTSQTNLDTQRSGIELEVAQSDISKELAHFEGIENVLSNLSNIPDGVVTSDKDELMDQLQCKVRELKQQVIARKNLVESAVVDRQQNGKLSRELLQAKESISHLQTEIVTLKSSSPVSAIPPNFYDYSQTIQAETEVDGLIEIENVSKSLLATMESLPENDKTTNQKTAIQSLQEKVVHLRQTAVARRNAADVAAAEYQQRLKLQELLEQAQAKIVFLQSELDSSLAITEQASRVAEETKNDIDQIKEKEIQNIIQIEQIIQTQLSVVTQVTHTNVTIEARNNHAELEQLMNNLKQKIQEQRQQIESKNTALEAAAVEKANNLKLTKALETSKNRIQALENEIQTLKESNKFTLNNEPTATKKAVNHMSAELDEIDNLLYLIKDDQPDERSPLLDQLQAKIETLKQKVSNNRLPSNLNENGINALEERQRRLRAQETLAITNKKLVEMTNQVNTLKKSLDQVQSKTKDASTARKAEATETKQKLTDLDGELKTLREDNDDLKKRLAKSNQQVIEQTEIFRKQEELANMEKEALKKTLESRERELESLNTMMSSRQSRMPADDSPVTDQDYKNLAAEKVELENAINTLNAEIFELKANIRKIESNNKTLKETLEKVEQQNTQLVEESRMKSELHSQQILAKSIEIDALREGLEALEREKHALLLKQELAQHDLLHEQLNAAEQKSETTIVELEMTRKRLDAILAENDVLNEKISSLFVELHTDRASADVQKRSLQDVIASKDVAIQSLKERLEVMAKQQESSTQSSDTAMMEKEFKLAQQELAAYAVELKSLKIRLDQAVAERDTTSEKMRLLENESQMNVFNSEKILRRTDTELNEKDAHIAVLSQKLKIMERQALARRVAIETAADESQKKLKAQEEYSVARLKISEYETQIKQLGEVIEKYKQEKSSLKDQVVRLEEQEMTLRQQVDEYHEKLQEELNKREELIHDFRGKYDNANRQSYMARNAVEVAALSSMDSVRLREQLEDVSIQAERAQNKIIELNDAIRRSEDLIRNLKAQNQLLIKRTRDTTTDTTNKDTTIEKLKEKLAITERQSLARKSAIEAAAADHVEKIKLQAQVDTLARKYDEAVKLSEFLSIELSKTKSKDEMMGLQRSYTAARSRDVLNEPSPSLSRANTIKKSTNNLIERTLSSSSSQIMHPENNQAPSTVAAHPLPPMPPIPLDKTATISTDSLSRKSLTSLVRGKSISKASIGTNENGSDSPSSTKKSILSPSLLRSLTMKGKRDKNKEPPKEEASPSGTTLTRSNTEKKKK